MSTPDYVLTEDFEHYLTRGGEPLRLKAGSFVRPIEYGYLPTHIKNDDTNHWDVKTGKKIYCYTRFGILPIPAELVARKR